MPRFLTPLLPRMGSRMRCLLSSRRNSGGNMRGVLADAQQDPGLAVVEKVHAQEIEPWEPRDAALLHRKSIAIKHRQVDPAIVKTIPGGPDHGGHTSHFEIQCSGGMPA